MSKKLISVTLALVLCLSLFLPGLAVRANEAPETVGSSEKAPSDQETAPVGETGPAAGPTDPVQEPAPLSCYEKLMACTTYQEMKTLMGNQEAFQKLDKDQQAAVRTKLDGLRTLFDKFMECQSPEEMKALEAATPKEELDKLTPEQQDQIRAWAQALKTAAEEAAKKAVPGETVPGETVPGETVPGETVPGETVPGETVPGETVPDEVGQITGEQVLAFYEQMMACQTIDEMYALLDTAPENILELLSEEQRQAVDAKADALDVPAEEPLPSDEQSLPEEELEDSTVFVPAKNYLEVARFRAPVTRTALFATLFAAPAETTAEKADNGLKLNKTAVDNGNGTYTVSLEAYATGSKVITEVTESVPTDIILVLDQSRSMADPMESAESYVRYVGSERRNDNLYGYRSNGFYSGNLYYKLEDGSYVSVNVDREYSSSMSYDAYSEGTTNSTYYNNSGHLYARMADGSYQKVNVERGGSFLWGRNYTYTLADGTQICYSEGSSTTPVFNGIQGNTLYAGEKTENTDERLYTYSYNLKGVTTVITTSTGDRTEVTTDFYYYSPKSISRKAALVSALTSFKNSVQAKAVGPDGLPGTDDDVNHRIAVVGFASGKSWQGKNYNYGNTELFDGATQIRYPDITDDDYAGAFKSMNTTEGQQKITSSINALEADGGTLIDLGMKMANNILGNNPVVDQNRNRVVVVFTDGQPGWSGYDQSTANAAITEAGITKDTYKATVYTVGIFDGADGGSAGDPYGDNVEKSNWFMQNLSSNGGTPQTESYYLSASNAAGLDSIFQNISSQIESGGSSTTLNEKAVIKDIISPYFVLPEGADDSSIRLESYSVTGKSGGEYIWSKNPDAMGARVTIGTKVDPATGLTLDTVDVTGFNFSENFVGTVTTDSETSYQGSKLVISFEVEARDGFLGGNHVPTNQEAGIFENKHASKPVDTFPVPEVDVVIPTIRVVVPDGYVYLNGTVKRDKLAALIEIYCGSYRLDLVKGKAGSYGLEPWQARYIQVTSQNDENDFIKVQNDFQYDVIVRIDPTLGGTETGSGSSSLGRIRVMTPTSGWQDSEVNGGVTPSYLLQNHVGTGWYYWDTQKEEPVTVPADSIVDTRDQAPTLDFSFDPPAHPVYTDTPVKVTVSLDGQDITGRVHFDHTLCSVPGCSWTEDCGCQFIVHVNTFDLAIQKEVDALNDPDDTFIFRIEGPGGYCMDVVLKGGWILNIKGLPAGNYTITEITDWSTGYEAQNTVVRVGPGDVVNGTAQANFTNLRRDVPLTGSAAVENRWYIPYTEAE